MSKYLPTIGLEIHTELNTKTKMFSNSINDINSLPNTNINEIDLGMPGILPSINKQAIIKAIRLAKALDMNIDSLLKFDRKNYFYQDLPKGYQITQQYKPIGRDGKLNDVIIQRIHLEEDTAKQYFENNRLCLDYNRAGIPLIEIVTEPMIHSTKQAMDFLITLRNILVFADISDGKMEEGSFRVDVNISLAKYDDKQLGTKVEIKNINSFANVVSAIDFEINRQLAILDKGEKIQQETRRWDDVSQQTKFMRIKSDEVDYHYFPEPNIINIDISSLIVETSVPKLPTQVKQELLDLGITNDIVEQLINNFNIYRAFTYLTNKTKNTKAIITWLLIELPPLLKQTNHKFNDVSNNFLDSISELILLIEKSTINIKQAKTIFEHMWQSKKRPAQLIDELGFKQIVNDDLIKNQLQKIIENNKQMLNQYNSRPERVEKMFIGLLMKETKGQVNPNKSIEILRKIIKDNIN